MLGFSVCFGAAAPGLAYPGGTPAFQTDAAPYCASCHSSLSVEALAGAPGDRATKELAENKHIALILAGEREYAKLDPAQRAELAGHIRALDQASTVAVTAPPKVQVGEEFTVTVKLAGGAGPVIGVALVDAAHRWQARPAPGAGWFVVGAPTIIGQDFKEQQKWLSRRGGDKNLSYVNVTGIQSDASTQEWGRAEVVWRLRATASGKRPLVAVYWYGTEKGSPLGTYEDPIRGKLLRGGFTGQSGRVRFSEPTLIEVTP
jgi:hypothetical protein